MDNESGKLQAECDKSLEMIRKCVDENAHSAIDQADYQRRYADLEEHYELTKNRVSQINQKCLERAAKSDKITEFLKTLSESDALLTEFDEELWNATIDTVIVSSKHELTFKFKDDTVLDCKM